MSPIRKLVNSLAHARSVTLMSASLFVSLLSLFPRASAAEDASALVQKFWHADSLETRAAAADEIVNAKIPVSTLMKELSAGRLHRDDVPTGIVLDSRISDTGLELPYVLIVPKTYDPERRYPVEFMLHGGVGRGPWEEGDVYWRRGYDALASEDKITIVPAGWRDAHWWHEEQAKSLPAILRRVKRDYNVDDNRVTMSGVSDGGTGSYFYAFKQSTPFAAFLPFIGNAGVLRNPQSGGGYWLFFENLRSKPLFIVNSENDPLYPAASIEPFISILDRAEVDHEFTVIENGGHNLDWMPDQIDRIEAFKRDNPRDALPDSVQWLTDRTDIFNRNHWLVVESRTSDEDPAIVIATRSGNKYEVNASSVGQFSLLLSPDEIDFSKPVSVVVNDEEKFSGMVEQSAATLLKWAQEDLDRTMLFSAELAISLEN